MKFTNTKAQCVEVKDSFVDMMKSTGKFYKALGLTPVVFTKELAGAIRKRKEELASEDFCEDCIEVICEE